MITAKKTHHFEFIESLRSEYVSEYLGMPIALLFVFIFLVGKGREVISVVNYAKSIWFSEKTCLLPSHGWSCEVGYLTFLFYTSDGWRNKWKKSVNGKAHCIMDEPWRIFFLIWKLQKLIWNSLHFWWRLYLSIKRYWI